LKGIVDSRSRFAVLFRVFFAQFFASIGGV